MSLCLQVLLNFFIVCKIWHVYLCAFMKKEKNPDLYIVVGVGHCFGNLLLMLMDIVGVVYRIMWLIVSVNVC